MAKAWNEVETIGRAREIQIEVPRPAAHHPAATGRRIVPAVIGAIGVELIEAAGPVPDIAGQVRQPLGRVTIGEDSNGCGTPDMGLEGIAAAIPALMLPRVVFSPETLPLTPCPRRDVRSPVRRTKGRDQVLLG